MYVSHYFVFTVLMKTVILRKSHPTSSTKSQRRTLLLVLRSKGACSHGEVTGHVATCISPGNARLSPSLEGHVSHDEGIHVVHAESRYNGPHVSNQSTTPGKASHSYSSSKMHVYLTLPLLCVLYRIESEWHLGFELSQCVVPSKYARKDRDIAYNVPSRDRKCRHNLKR